MIRSYFHRWEQELAAVSQHERSVRPFEWGEEWIDEPQGSSPQGLDRVSDWVERVMHDTDAFFTPEPARYTFTTAPESIRQSGEDGLLTFASGFTTPHAENNTVVARYFPAKPILKPRPGSPRRAVVVLAQWNSDPERPHRVVQDPVAPRHRVAAHQPAVSRCPQAAGAGARRLHRQLEHRSHAAGEPPGGARRQARAMVAARPGLRPARPARHQPGLVPVVPDDRARAAGARAGVESRVAIFRRRRVARAVDGTRAPGTRRPRQSRDATASVAANQPVVVPRSAARQADADGLREVRSHLPRRFVAHVDRSSSAAAATRCRSACCPAGTTRPACRPSSISTRGIWESFWRRGYKYCNNRRMAS